MEAGTQGVGPVLQWPLRFLQVTSWLCVQPQGFLAGPLLKRPVTGHHCFLFVLLTWPRVRSGSLVCGFSPATSPAQAPLQETALPVLGGLDIKHH